MRALRRSPLLGPILLWLALPALAGETASSSETAPAPSALEACLRGRELPRVARVRDPQGRVVYARVVAQRDGVPARLARLAPAQTPLAEVLERAAAPPVDAAPFEIPAADRSERICAPVELPQAQIEAGTRMVVAAGLNYAAHADETGGGEVFLFPKPSEPTGPYTVVRPPAGVSLLDYEIELGFVLLRDVDLRDPPPLEELLSQTAFFVSNDVSDREPILRYKTLGGPGTGFVDAKGQPGFLPTGPWMVRGSELFAAVSACGADGLGLKLWVDEGEGPALRQSASTSRMILPPRELLLRIGEEVEEQGLLTDMPARRDGSEHFHPLALDASRPRLPAGSVVLTGTPEGVAVRPPSSRLGVTLRGILRLRGPLAQYLSEEKARVADGERGRYLKPGDRVIAHIDGLGTQEFAIGPAGEPPLGDPCRDAPTPPVRRAGGEERR